MAVLKQNISFVLNRRVNKENVKVEIDFVYFCSNLNTSRWQEIKKILFCWKLFEGPMNWLLKTFSVI